MRRLGVSLLVGFGLLSLSALADSINFNLTTVEGGAATPLADQITVTVTTGTGVTSTHCPAGTSGVDCVSVQFSTPTGVTLGGDPVEINVNPTGYTGIGSITTLTAALVAGTQGTPGGPGSEDTFGQMSFITAGGTAAFTQLTIYLSGTWSSAANVLTPTCGPDNTSPDPDPGCVIGKNDPASENQANSSTGFGTEYPNGFEAEATAIHGDFNKQTAGEYTGSSVPEPTSVILFGSVALLVGGALRRKLVS